MMKHLLLTCPYCHFMWIKKARFERVKFLNYCPECKRGPFMVIQPRECQNHEIAVPLEQ